MACQLIDPDVLKRRWPCLTPQQQERFLKLIGPRMTSFIPVEPFPKQAQFLVLDDVREAFFGGAAGGGKSEALLMAALQYVDVPGYAAILFRRTHTDLALEGALMNRADEWLSGTDARWNSQDKRWTFPSSATLTFGYMEAEKDKFRYKSAEFQMIGFDELTQFSETQYRFMFSRLRRKQGQVVPLRMRSASNPGDVGHDWVKERFILFPEHGRVFIPSRIADNPALDQAEYIKSLDELDPVTRAQMLAGDWDAYEGGMFRREWFPTVETAPVDARRIRGWDKAGTKDRGDWSVGVLMAMDDDGIFWIEDVIRGRWSSFERNKIIKQTADLDAQKYKKRYSVAIEQEPGSGGKESAEWTIKQLAGYTIDVDKPTGEKRSRASPLASQAQAGNVRMVIGPWNKAFIDEMCLFTGDDKDGPNDDQVDAASLSFNQLALKRRLKAYVL